MVWTDRDGRDIDVPEPPAAGSRYPEIGAFQAEHYERNAFTRGTGLEARFLRDALDLRPGHLLLDVGCATGRHLRALAADGIRGVGVDLSFALVRAGAVLVRTGAGVAPPGLLQADAGRLPFAEATFDAAISVCQGGFGITPAGDRRMLGELSRVLRPGGRAAVTAFSLPFAARYLDAGDAIDLDRGMVWSRAEVRGPDGARRSFDLWTACYTPAELRAGADPAGLHVDALYGAEPGRYGRRPPRITDPELLVLLRKD